MSNSMVASHAFGKGSKPDAVFAISGRAKEAIARVGLDKVVNASIGAIYDDNEKFATLSVVDEYFRKLPAEELMNYAPIGGTAGFIKSAIEQVFMGNQPENTYVKALATSGGTGAIRHVFYNYLENGDKALVPDWCWGNYHTIASEHQRATETYTLFDENNNLNLASIKEKVEALIKCQNNIVIIFNTPAHNPTGYSLTVKEWTGVLDLFKTYAEDKTKKIVILVDMAYIDYAGKPEETRAFMKLFGGLPENILITFAYSMSKSFMMYGLRSGALVGLSSSPEVVDEMFKVNTASSRGVWSNGTRGAQALLAEVSKYPELNSKISIERCFYSNTIAKRAAIFMEEAKAVNLAALPYRSGFFITIPSTHPLAVTQNLEKDNIYALNLKKGVRVAICGIPTHKVPGIASKMKAAMK